MAEKHSLVRILKDPENMIPEGAGVLISEQEILTCDHVVEAAILDGVVYLDFHLIAPNRVLRARPDPEKRFPASASPPYDKPDDLALLRLEADQILPEEASPALFLEPDERCHGLEVAMCGFPRGRDRGEWAYGKLIGETGEGWFQLDHDLASGVVHRGFSGTPVFVEKTAGKVAGLIVTRYEEAGRVSAFMIPVRTLCNVCQLCHSIMEPEQTARNRAPVPYANPSRLIRPGGAIDIDSPFYIRREADGEVMNEIHLSRGLVTLRGPRQVGKTSLLLNVFAHARDEEDGLRPVFIDFQTICATELESMNGVWRKMAADIRYQLDIEGWEPEDWNGGAGYDRNITSFLDDFVFRDADSPLLICLDEVDRVFRTPIQGDFFSSIRSFFNKGAYDPAWKRVRWLLSTSSEPGFFIQDLSESPFNIGLRVPLNAFTREETERFAALHGLDLSPEVMDRIMDYLGGRPYLVHLLFFHMARSGEQEKYLDAASGGGGIFTEHLNRYLRQFRKENELAGAMRRIIDGRVCRNIEIAERLEAAGLVCCIDPARTSCACSLYADYFSGKI